MTRRELQTRIEELRDECGRDEDYEAHALLAMLAWRLEGLPTNPAAWESEPPAETEPPPPTREAEAPAEPEPQAPQAPRPPEDDPGRPPDEDGYVPWHVIEEDR